MTTLDNYVSPTGQPLNAVEEFLLEAELQHMGIRVLAGFPLPLESEHAARLLVRVLGVARASESPLHAAADASVARFSLAFRYAFAVARKAVKSKLISKNSKFDVATPIRLALNTVLPGLLVKAATDGGQVALDALSLKTASAHKFATTQVNLPHDVAAKLAVFPIAESDLTGDGRELNSHITVKYGLIETAPSEVRASLTGERPAKATLGKVTAFEGVENGTADAVIIEVFSKDLERWNKKISAAVQTAETHHTYKPHATIAYVKPGLGKKYAGNTAFEGIDLSFDSLVFSSKDDQIVSLRVASEFRAAGPFKQRFDGKNPSVIEWAKKHAGELIVNIIEATLNQIQLASEEFQDEGDWDLYYGRILDAVGDEERADLIARHETMLAAGEGQRLGWEQAKKAGLLDNSVKRVWITTPDERTCPICKGLEDKTAPLGGEYPGGYVGPPAHVQCRCTEGIQ